MLKGLYTAYTGMINEQHRMDVMTNNLANADTNGFKKEGATSQAFDSVLAYKIKDLSEAGNLPRLISTAKGVDTYELSNEANPDYAQNRVRRVGMNMGVKTGENYVDYSEGPMKVTGNTFDFAIAGSGFFLVEYTNKAGETSVKYTRDGNFTMNSQGYLVTQDGDYVLDEDRRRIRLDPNEKEIGTNVGGDIFQAGEYVATIGVVDFEDYDRLERFGENFSSSQRAMRQKRRRPRTGVPEPIPPPYRTRWTMRRREARIPPNWKRRFVRRSREKKRLSRSWLRRAQTTTLPMRIWNCRRRKHR